MPVEIIGMVGTQGRLRDQRAPWSTVPVVDWMDGPAVIPTT